MAKSWKFKSGVIGGMLVIIIPLAYELWDAGVLPLPFESNTVEWYGVKKLTCGGSQEIVIDSATAYNKDKMSPAMITAGGHCKLRVMGSTITGHKIIWAGGNAEIIIEGSKLDAVHTAVQLAGNARLSVKQSTIKGKRAAVKGRKGSPISYDKASKFVGRVSGKKTLVAESSEASE